MSRPIPSTIMLRARPIALALIALLLTGCATTHTVRGKITYDLRPEMNRGAIVWPQPPDPPRYRYMGELVGEDNFVKEKKKALDVETVFKWIVGWFDNLGPTRLQRPQHGVVSDNGRIYVVDAGRNAVVVFDPNPPEDDKDDDQGGHMMVWDRIDANVRFAAPIAVALVWNGDIAVSDAGHGAVLRLNTKGELVGTFGAGELKRPAGLAFDPEHGLLFVADVVAHDIKVYDPSGRLVKTIGKAGEGDGSFNAPTHLAFASGHLYVSDTLNNRIQIFDVDGERVRVFGERGLYVGNLTRPKGVAVAAGITYVVESYFGYLLAYNEKSELLLGINGNGMKGDRFVLPSGVWTDKHGRIYVADMFNGRVVMFQLIGGEAR